MTKIENKLLAYIVEMSTSKGWVVFTEEQLVYEVAVSRGLLIPAMKALVSHDLSLWIYEYDDEGNQIRSHEYTPEREKAASNRHCLALHLRQKEKT